jgi:hypothetical protein
MGRKTSCDRINPAAASLRFSRAQSDRLHWLRKFWARRSNQNASWRAQIGPTLACRRLAGSLHDYEHSCRRASPAGALHRQPRRWPPLGRRRIRAPNHLHGLTRRSLRSSDWRSAFWNAGSDVEVFLSVEVAPSGRPSPARLVVPLRPLRFGSRNAQKSN